MEVWNIEKSIRVRTFEVKASKKFSNNAVRSMVLAPDESFLAVAIRNKIAYYSTAELKSSPSESVYSGLDTDNLKFKNICSKIYPLNSFEGSSFDIMEVGVNPKNMIMMITRNQD